MNKIALSLVLMANFALITSDSIEYRFRGQEITPDTLFDIANLPEFRQPEEQRVLLRGWINDNADLFYRLLKNPRLWSQAGMLTVANVKFLNYIFQEGNLGNPNYIFSPGDNIYGQDYSNILVKVGCHAHRLVNLLRKHGEQEWFYGVYVNGTKLPDEIDEEISTDEPTYQTSSIMARYILARTFLDDNEIVDVDVPRTYLMNLDGTSDVSDENSVIVTERIPGLIRLEDYVKTNDLTESQITNLLRLILGASIWDICSNTFVKDDVVYVIDLEQPNNCSPDTAFFKVYDHGFKDTNEWNAMSGITKFYNVLVKYGKSGQEQIIRDWVSQNDLIKGFKRFSNLKKDIALLDDAPATEF